MEDIKLSRNELVNFLNKQSKICHEKCKKNIKAGYYSQAATDYCEGKTYDWVCSFLNNNSELNYTNIIKD
jgi:hypothetical protein